MSVFDFHSGYVIVKCRSLGRIKGTGCLNVKRHMFGPFWKELFFGIPFTTNKYQNGTWPLVSSE